MSLFKPFRLSLLIIVYLQASIVCAEQYKLAIGAIFKNEKPYLKEWIDFHRLVGVNHFYLYDNLSTDNPKEVLDPYIKAGIVELIHWSRDYETPEEWNKIQCAAYNNALKRARDVAHWIAFIDTDEFLYPVEKTNLITVLKNFDDYCGIVVNEQSFGTSKVYKIPQDKLLIETLLYKAPLQKKGFVKSIVQPNWVIRFTNARIPLFKKKYWGVNTNKEKSLKENGPIVMDKIRINHYWTRDENYFYNTKLVSRKKRGFSDEKDFEEVDKSNSIKDTVILRFASQLQEYLDAPSVN
jgi:hypothetical protein